MSALSDAAVWTKRLLLGAAIFTAVYIIASLAFGVGKKMLRQFTRGEELPEVEARFGKLPPLAFEPLPIVGEEPPEFILETVSGGLPKTPDLIDVFPVIVPPLSIKSGERATELAKSMGFKAEPRVIRANEYYWESPKRGKTLTMNVVSRNFLLKTSLDLIEPLLAKGTLATSGGMIGRAEDFFGDKGVLDSSFSGAPRTVVYMNYSKGEFSKAISLSEATMARVDIFRQLEIGKSIVAVLGNHPKESSVYALYGGGKSGGLLVASNQSWSYDYNSPSTYPLADIRHVWSEIKKGEGKIAYLKNPKEPTFTPYTPQELHKVTIHKVDLAYFDHGGYQPALQPIYVFEGEAELITEEKLEYIAYYPAIHESFILEPETSD